MKKRLLEYMMVFVLLSPLLYINIRDSHDWGDDFAAYLRQAENIVQGKPYYQSRFEFHDYNAAYSPPYYPYGFPLLLAPVIRCFGLDFRALDIYMSLWLVAWALLIFGHLRRYFSLFACVSFLLIFFLNPFFFEFKASVISDVPFSFFFLLFMLLYLGRRGRSLVYLSVSGLTLAFAVGIRSVGLVFLPVILIEFGIKCISFFSGSMSKKDLAVEAKEAGVIVLSALFFLFISGVIFRGNANLTFNCGRLLSTADPWALILDGLNIYTIRFGQLFDHDAGSYAFTVRYTSAFMLVLLVIGFVNTVFRRHSTEMLIMTAYCAVVLLFPNFSQGFRYLLPVLPVFMLCIITGAQSIRTAPGYKRTLLALFFVIFTLLQYKREVFAMKEDQKNIIWPGPCTDDNKKAFDYIRSSVPDTAVILCLKPRALELFTDKRTCMLPAGNDMRDIAEKLTAARPAYLLSIRDLGPEIDSLAAFRRDSLIWENNSCRLYMAGP